MTQEYFDKLLNYRRAQIPEMELVLANAKGGPRNVARYSYSIFREAHEFLVLLYSAGASLSDIRAAFPRVIETGERYFQLAREAYSPEQKPQQPTFIASFSDYITALRVVTLAIILDLDLSSFTRLVKLFDNESKGNNEGQDLLYEALTGTRLSGRKKAVKLLYPKPFKALFEAISANKEDQPHLVEEFLRTWYPSMKNAYWHDNHKGPEGGGFFGYWAFEAAGVVRAFHLDDSTFRDMPYYPKDLFTP